MPPILLALAKHPAVDSYDLSSVEIVYSGAAPLDAELAGAVEDGWAAGSCRVTA